jgi:5-methylcytosine-specific restriction endonuclease McrA
MTQVLILNQSGSPVRWGSTELAIMYHAKKLVAWQVGDNEHIVFRGGQNRVTGNQSRLSTAPIIAVTGDSSATNRKLHSVPLLTNRELFARDRWTCAYCGRRFSEYRLTRDHIVPLSRGGKDTWMNVVTACDYDNRLKDDMLLEEAGMELLYAPYTPNRAEHLILKGRAILPIQAEYLSQYIPETSAVHSILKELHNSHEHK